MEDTFSYSVPKEWNWPDALRKAVDDPFDYALYTKEFGWVDFTEAQDLNPEWVRLLGVKLCYYDHKTGLDVSRGLDIRVSMILAVIDAPRGS